MDLVEQLCCEGGVVLGEGLDDQLQRGDGQLAGTSYGSESGHVVPLDRAVQRPLESV